MTPIATNEPAEGPTAFPTTPIPPAAPPPPAGPTYAPYAPAPTVAVWTSFGYPVSLDELIEPADAEDLAATFASLYGKPTKVVDNTPPSGVFGITYGAETRRMLGIQIGTAGTDALSMAANPMLTYAQGYVKLSQQQYGVGSPGGWSLKSNGGNPPTLLPVWIPAPPAPPVSATPNPAALLLNAETALSLYNASGAAPMKIVPDV